MSAAASPSGGPPAARQTANSREKALARWFSWGIAAFSTGRWASIQSRISSIPSGSRAAICSFSQMAAVGLLPPVEMPTDRLPRRTRAGNRKLHRAGSSTTFTGRFCPRHRAETWAFTAPSSAAAMTKSAPSRSSGEKGRRSTVTPGRSARAGRTSGATTVRAGP